jgi:hypothetical protein
VSWKLIFVLSLFGLAMGFATVFAIGPSLEPYAWLGVLVVCAWIIAKRAPGQFFLHGLLVCVVNSLWITAAHYLLFDKYAVNHASELAMMARMGAPKTMILAFGPVGGLGSGIVLGIVSFVMSKFVVSSHSEFAGW